MIFLFCFFVTALGLESKIPSAISKSNEANTSPKEKDNQFESGCSCDAEDNRRSTFSDEEAEQLIEFEDELHNIVYVR